MRPLLKKALPQTDPKETIDMVPHRVYMYPRSRTIVYQTPS